MELYLSQKGREKKEQIIKAAQNRFASDGLFRVTLKAIAKDCGIKTSLLLYHFSGIDDLFFHVVTHVVREGQTLAQNYINNAPKGPPRLAAMVDAMFDWVALNPKNQAIMLQFYSQCMFDSKLKELNAQVIAGGRARIQRILDEGIELNFFPPMESPAIAATIQNLITGALVRASTNSANESISALRKATQENSLKLLQGIKP